MPPKPRRTWRSDWSSSSRRCKVLWEFKADCLSKRVENQIKEHQDKANKKKDEVSCSSGSCELTSDHHSAARVPAAAGTEQGSRLIHDHVCIHITTSARPLHVHSPPARPAVYTHACASLALRSDTHTLQPGIAHNRYAFRGTTAERMRRPTSHALLPRSLHLSSSAQSRIQTATRTAPSPACPAQRRKKENQTLRTSSFLFLCVSSAKSQ